jgi:hypothetical protein
MKRPFLVCSAMLAGLLLAGSVSAQATAPFTLHDKPWRGVPMPPAKTTDVARPGGAPFSLRWDAGKPGTNTITFRFSKRDFSQYDTLSVWVYAEKATFATITIFVTSPNGHDYDGYRAEFTVDEEKQWVRYTFPLDRFMKNRNPAGWESITSVAFLTSWGDSAPVEGTVLYLSDMRFELGD